MNFRKLFAILFGIAAAVLAICAVWLHQDWGWLKFLITSIIVALVAIFLAASEDDQKRP